MGRLENQENPTPIASPKGIPVEVSPPSNMSINIFICFTRYSLSYNRIYMMSLRKKYLLLEFTTKR